MHGCRSGRCCLVVVVVVVVVVAFSLSVDIVGVVSDVGIVSVVVLPDVGSCSRASYLKRNSAMDDSIGGS